MSETSFGYALNAAIAEASSSSQRATGIPHCRMAATARAPPARLSNVHTAAEHAVGSGCSLSCSSVITPSVPSEPTSRRVRSYPALDLRALPPVRITRPSASTAVVPSTFSRIVPYLTAAVPLAPQAAIPPREASAPGSIGKIRPVWRRCVLSARRVTPACTRQSMSPSFTCRIASMSERSRQTPPCSAWICPSSEVPEPNGIIGTRASAQSRTMPTTSSVLVAQATTSGGMAAWCDSSSPCRWRMDGLVETRAHARPSRSTSPSDTVPKFGAAVARVASPRRAEPANIRRPSREGSIRD
mmetsp:Transcript_28984/g.66570  ORF Transcript_28984/g.66570 Transcript_28984/m.66570 type:complete len:300 (-) Transcript_28984:73-972(-)